jgi:hypothetical protein
MTTNRALLNLDAIPALFDHLVAPVRELHALGISTHAISERCKPGGPWQRLEPNLILLTAEPPNRTQQVQAALKSAGKDAVLSGLDALKLHGMSGAKLSSPIHVLLPPSRRQPGLVDGVYYDTTHQLPAPLHRGGFPVAPLPRATVDTCRRINHEVFIRQVLSETIYKGKITPATLREEIDRLKPDGLTLPRKVLAAIDDSVRSIARGWAKRLVQQAGLPTPAWRVPITSTNGTHVATTDAWWDEVGLAWEVDSYAFDLSPTDAVAALARAARLTAAGVLVVHTTPAQLKDDPAVVADLLRGAYQRAAARPRPEVKAQCTPPKPQKRKPTKNTPPPTPKDTLPAPQPTQENTPTTTPTTSSPPQSTLEDNPTTTPTKSQETQPPTQEDSPPTTPEPSQPAPQNEPQRTQPTPHNKPPVPTPSQGPTPPQPLAPQDPQLTHEEPPQEPEKP